MKILILTDYSPTFDNAPASRLLHLAREISKEGHKVRVVGSITSDCLIVPGVEVIILPYQANGGMNQGIFPFHKEIRKHIRWCDALLVRGYWIAFWSFLYAAVSRIKLRIYDFHGFMWKEQFFQNRRIRSMATFSLEIMGLFLSTKVLAVSKGVSLDLQNNIKRKALVVENGVALETFQKMHSPREITDLKKRFKLPDGKPIFAIVASFGSWLDPVHVVHAVSKLNNIVELMLVGDGPGIEKAKTEALNLKTENVHIIGKLRHEEVAAFLTGALYGCICPYESTWINSHKPDYFASRKVKEYMAAGIPIIVSDIPGRGSFLCDRKTCLLYNPKNSYALADKIKELIDNPILANRIGANAKRLAKQFAWKAICSDSGLFKIFLNP